MSFLSITRLYFKQNKPIESSDLFNNIIDNFGLSNIYDIEATVSRARQRKELKRIFRIIFNIYDEIYIGKNTDDKFKTWSK